MKVEGWICVQPAIIVFEMLCPQIGTNLRKSFTAPYINTNENRYYNICTSYGGWSVKKPRRGVDSFV